MPSPPSSVPLVPAIRRGRKFRIVSTMRRKQRLIGILLIYSQRHNSQEFYYDDLTDWMDQPSYKGYRFTVAELVTVLDTLVRRGLVQVETCGDYRLIRLTAIIREVKIVSIGRRHG